MLTSIENSRRPRRLHGVTRGRNGTRVNRVKGGGKLPRRESQQVANSNHGDSAAFSVRPIPVAY